MTHWLGSTIVFTRYTNCFKSETLDNIDGNWLVARAEIKDEEVPVRIVASYGFHEEGTIINDSIHWTNGAVWKMNLDLAYETDKGAIRLVLRDDGDYDVKTEGEYVGRMQRRTCTELVYNSTRGLFKTGFVEWEDGEIWWSVISSMSLSSVTRHSMLLIPAADENDTYDVASGNFNNFNESTDIVQEIANA